MLNRDPSSKDGARDLTFHLTQHNLLINSIYAITILRLNAREIHSPPTI
ncbi:hypothetical protein [Rubritalea tangerina]